MNKIYLVAIISTMLSFSGCTEPTLGAGVGVGVPIGGSGALGTSINVGSDGQIHGSIGIGTGISL